ncbi:hypothetical protein [Desulforegula conservatrix]|uniref:hypothetical protein n=1 Tax=Desulforegula conservatrix TaxID=153026 RepID=UPI000489A92F|nr:hypothetical protein [Desulforegula conservatrix]
MLFDSIDGLRKLHKRFEEFLASSSQYIEFNAITASDPSPYDELLRGLRVIKNSGAAQLTFSNDSWLVLTGSLNDLTKFTKKLLVERDGSHHHWYSNPLSLIIEAD